MSPDISVIVPIYNSASTINRCIESILDQTMTTFELLLIDDGSHDNSLLLCRVWANRDRRIKVLHQINAGASAARNLGIKEACGKWLVFIDSDDTVSPNYLNNLLNGTYDDTTVDLCISGIQVFRYNTKSEIIEFPVLKCFISDYNIIFGKIHLHKYGFSVGKLYRKSIIDRKGLQFDENICIAEDYLFMLNYIICCTLTNDSKISFVSQCDYNYFIHKGSLSTSVSCYEKEYYCYKKYRETIFRLRNALNIDSNFFHIIHAPISYYADRVILSIYQDSSSVERIKKLKSLDTIEYKTYKKCNSVFESLMVYLLSNNYWRLYDFIRYLTK